MHFQNDDFERRKQGARNGLLFWSIRSGLSVFRCVSLSLMGEDLQPQGGGENP